MIKFSIFEFRSKLEAAIYVIVFACFSYFILNGVIFDGVVDLPALIEVPIYIVGFIAFFILLILITAFLVDYFIKDRSIQNNRAYELLKFIEEKPDLLAPNLDAESRSKVIEAIRKQMADSTISAAYAIVDEGEESAQVVILQSDSPKSLRHFWNELSDGTEVVNTKAAKHRYDIDLIESGLEVVWD